MSSVTVSADSDVEMDPSLVRWSAKKKEKNYLFCGNDSLNLEHLYQDVKRLRISDEQSFNAMNDGKRLIIGGGKGRVAFVDGKLCMEVLWSDTPWKLVRGVFFYRSGKQSIPLEDEDDELNLAIEDLKKNVDATGGKGKKWSVYKSNTRTVKIQYYGGKEFGLTIWKKDKSSFSCFRSKYLRIRRGFDTIAVDTDTADPIKAITYCVLGVDEEKMTGNIEQNTESLWTMTRCLEEKNMLNSTCPMVPIKWNESVPSRDEMLMKIASPAALKMLGPDLFKDMANNVGYFVDVDSKRKSLVDGLNKAYAKIKAFNPAFAGNVTVVALSSASVVMYDVLNRDSTGLLFSVNTFVMMGSMLTASLKPKNLNRVKLDFQNLQTKLRLVNIIDESDPLSHGLHQFLDNLNRKDLHTAVKEAMRIRKSKKPRGQTTDSDIRGDQILIPKKKVDDIDYIFKSKKGKEGHFTYWCNSDVGKMVWLLNEGDI